MFKSLTPSNPLFTAPYEFMCTDMDLTDADGSPEHRQMVFDMLFAGEAYQAKGEKVTMRRWFSWIQAADQFLPKWHSVLLNLICLGQTLRVYKYRKDVPLWNNGTRRKPKAQEGEGDSGSDGDQPEGDAGDAAAAVDNPASAAKEHEEDHGPTKQQSDEKQLKSLRAQSKNTLFVAAAVLSKDMSVNFTAMIVEVTRPIFTAHSKHARMLGTHECACLLHFTGNA